MTTEVDCEREPPCESMDDGADACVADEDAVCEPDPEASHAVAASAEENARKLAAQQARFVALCADDSLKVNNGEGISAGEVFEEMDRAGKSMLGCNILKTTDCYADAANIEEINMGKSLFYFSLKNADLMSVEEKRLIDCIVNLTTFRDETVEVGVPIVDVFDDADAAKYATILSKTAYLLPGVHLSQLTPQLISSMDYLSQCIPNGIRLWNDITDEEREKCMFHITKILIRFIYNIIAVFKVSSLASEHFAHASKAIGMRVDGGLLLERYERPNTPPDMTIKCKSVLFYTVVDGGILVNHVTCALNRRIPVIVSKVLNNFAYLGKSEVVETGHRTRTYLRKLFCTKCERDGDEGQASEEDVVTSSDPDLPTPAGDPTPPIPEEPSKVPPTTTKGLLATQ